MPRSNLNAGNRRLHVRARIWMLVMHILNWMTQIQNPLTEKLNRMTRELIWIVIFTARQNPANLNEIKMNLIVKFAILAGKSYTILNNIFAYIQFLFNSFWDYVPLGLLIIFSMKRLLVWCLYIQTIILFRNCLFSHLNNFEDNKRKWPQLSS